MSGAPGPGGGPSAPGLQAERTELAWQRTSLALATGSLLAGRLLAPGLGGWAWLAAGTGIGLAGALAAVSGRRGARGGVGGGLVVVCAVGALLLGVLALAVLLGLGDV